jgi:hypothetical protein
LKNWNNRFIIFHVGKEVVKRLKSTFFTAYPDHPEGRGSLSHEEEIGAKLAK